MPTTERPPLGRLAPLIPKGVAVLVTALSIAICAAAPEFIWRGLHVTLGHPHWIDLVGALLIGLNLVFFIEPAMKRFRDLIYRSEPHEPAGARPLEIFFTASLGLAFALASVSLHDAMAAFISRQGMAEDAGLREAVLLISAWAIVPFAVSLAWQSIGCRVLAVPTGLVAGASPFIAGWLFVWPLTDVITTAIPCLLILGLGYRRSVRTPDEKFLARHAPMVVLAAAGWLALALLVDVGLEMLGAEGWRLYDAPRFFVDCRFYLGWAAGLVFARFPAAR